MTSFVFCGKMIDERQFEQKTWLKYLYYTKENQTNLERIDSMEELLIENHVLRYVEKTLMILDSEKGMLSDTEQTYVRTTLEWSEVAKCGMPEQRMLWRKNGIDLQIHNEASAEIYSHEMKKQQTPDKAQKIITVLIRTHGLLGQYLRGETGFNVHKPLSDLISDGYISKESLSRVLISLNHAVIGAVSEELWKQLEDEVCRLVQCICDDDYQETEIPLEVRLGKMFPAFRHIEKLTEDEAKLYQEIFDENDLWYAESALDTFSRKEINTVFRYIHALSEKTRHISFYPLSRTLTYDYEGHRKINVYKKRIVELCLREHAENDDVTKKGKSADHVSICTELVGDTLYFDVKFTRVCDCLIQFCVEAERSDIMTYEKSIQTIFDFFGFRRDIFDRLNNEEKYLETMNNAEQSTKLEILNYITGNCIVDVGSGGGVLLDILEERYPEKQIIGTDISANVIERLKQKIDEENHHYIVKCHNFVECTMDDPVDTILFSSILHEVYSYTELEGSKFNIDAVKKALRNAYASLRSGGRIIIRDGVMANDISIRKVRFKKEDGISFSHNYMRDFKGLKHLRDHDDPDQWERGKVLMKGDVLTADVNFIREALYTYTWGVESYAQEVQEQFGYFTLDEYKVFMDELGMKIVQARMFTEPGYPDNLNSKVELLEGLTWDMLPSTCIIVAEKR